ncbi:MAG: murein biosynthesis integral membrane protein MurJ [Sedimentisphaerales bacterium]
MAQQKTMIRGFRQIALLTMASRVLGMLRDMTFAYFLGASGLMDGWAIAFKVPNLARRLFGEGAASSSLIPVYSEELQRDREKANRLAFTVVTAVFVLLTGIVLLGEGIIWGYYRFFSNLPGTQLKLKLSAIMLPYMVLICVVAILAGILHTHRHFAAPAAAPVVLNVFLIGSLCFSGWVFHIQPNRQVFIVAVAVILAGLVQLLIQLPPLRARGIYIRPAWQVRSEAFKKVILLMGPMVLGLTVTQINTLADDFIALWFSGSDEKGQFFSWFGQQIRYPLWEGAVSHLFYSQRLYQFPLGVLGISLATAIFPVMSTDAARKDFAALSKSVSQGLRCAVFVALPATAGLLVVARPLVSVIFERGQFTAQDTILTKWTLSFYVLGLCGYFAQQVATRAFYSMQDSFTPARSALIAVFANIVLNLTLIWFLGTGGLAAATAACSYLQVAILVAVLRRRLGSAVLVGLGRALAKTIVATLFMLIMVVAALQLSKSWADIFKLLLSVPSAAAVYLLAAKFLRIEMLSLLTGLQSAKADQF